MAGPIADLLGRPLGFNEQAKVILEGTFDVDSITSSLEACDIMKVMAHHDPSNPLSSESKLTLEKLKEDFSLVKESTALNPEGLHHGHWKSLIQHNDTFKPFGLMIMFAFSWAEPLAAWENALQICLPEDAPGKPLYMDLMYPTCMCCNENGFLYYLGSQDATMSDST